MALNVLLLGPQGAGKGTQAKRISAEYGIPHVASGEILRAEMAAETELGRRVKDVYDRGDLVSDDLMVELIRSRLAQEDTSDGFIIEGFARAGELVAETIALVGEHIQPGITTGELDRIADAFIREHGGVPTSMGYRGFPAATCISPNSMVVHGIPGEHRVEEGDLISIDVGVTLDGLIADSAYTFGVGEIT